MIPGESMKADKLTFGQQSPTEDWLDMLAAPYFEKSASLNKIVIEHIIHAEEKDIPLLRAISD